MIYYFMICFQLLQNVLEHKFAYVYEPLHMHTKPVIKHNRLFKLYIPELLSFSSFSFSVISIELKQ